MNPNKNDIEEIEKIVKSFHVPITNMADEINSIEQYKIHIDDYVKQTEDEVSLLRKWHAMQNKEDYLKK